MRQRRDFFLPNKSFRKTSAAKISTLPPVALSFWTQHCPALGLQLTLCFVAGDHLNAWISGSSMLCWRGFHRLYSLAMKMHSLLNKHIGRPGTVSMSAYVIVESVLTCRKWQKPTAAVEHSGTVEVDLEASHLPPVGGAVWHLLICPICPSPGIISVIWITSLKHKKVLVKDFPSCFCCAPYNNTGTQETGEE